MRHHSREFADTKQLSLSFLKESRSKNTGVIEDTSC